LTLDGQGHHPDAMLRRRRMASLLERLFPRDQKADFGEGKLFQRRLGNDQVTVMDRIKGTAQQAYH
jgi:hypothetical protein